MKFQNKHKVNQLSNLQIAMLLVLVVIAGFGGWLVLNKLDDNRQKSKFKFIEQDMQTVITKLKSISADAQPTISEHCQHDQQKFGGGQLNCLVSFDLVKKTDTSQIRSEVDNFSEILSSSNFAKEVELFDTEMNGSGQIIHIATNTNCFPSYRYDQDNNLLDLHLYCVRPMHRPIFPLVD